MTNKKFFRCNVCNDIHYGANPPEICQTCFAKNAYVETDRKEAVNVPLGEEFAKQFQNEFGKEELKRVWTEFTKKTDFVLNHDSWHVDKILEGLVKNEIKYGLRLCPCRIRDGTREKDLTLICPCNFKADNTWTKKDQCWCGLFVRK